MEWISRLNEAMAYLESHLQDEVNLDEAARIAACSSFHFQRMFSYLAGVPLGEYIRRRRLTLAALELTGGAKIIDVAVKYGYESPTAFSRAFSHLHGLSPSAAKKRGSLLTAYPPITFTMSIKGDTAMNYRIVNREGFRLVGISTKEPMTMEDCFEKIPQFWKKIHRENWLPRLCALMDGSEPAGILGVSACDGGTFSGFYVGVATSLPCPEDMEEYRVAPGSWAVFECIGPMPDAMQNLQQRILSEWLPASGYDYAPAPDIEVYFAGDQQSPDYRSEVWLPIVKKKE